MKVLEPVESSVPLHADSGTHDAILSGPSTLSSFLSRLQFSVDAWHFRQTRREYYDYLSALLEGTAGARTLKQVFADDARRYGITVARGRLSRRWLGLFQAAGGDLYATWYGVFPVAELSVLRSAQSRGNEVLIATFTELSRVLRIVETAKGILRSSLLTALLALAVLAATLLAMPSVTVPRLRVSFAMIPSEYHGAAASSLFRTADQIGNVWPLILVVVLALAWLIPYSFSRYAGRFRLMLDRVGPWRIYRQVQALQFLAMLAIALGKNEHGTTRLREALTLQQIGASPWLLCHIHAMHGRIDAGMRAAAAFDTGLLDPSQLWFLDDMIAARGLTTGLHHCSHWVERHVLGAVARKAAALRWCLLLAAVAGVLSVALWHYAAIDDLRRGLALFHASH